MKIEWLREGTSLRRCPVCGSQAEKPMRLSLPHLLAQRRDGPPLTLVLCPECTSAFYEDPSSAGYGEDEGLPAEGVKYYVEQGAGIDSMLGLLFRFRRDAISRYLEIGCGFGFSLDFAREILGWQVRGVDPSHVAQVGRALLGLRIDLAYLTEESELPDAPFDLIMCSEVIEHVPEPHGLLGAVLRLLTDDGALALTTPNAAAIRPDTPSGVLLPLLSPGYHPVLYTRASLDRLLREAGFSHVEVSESSYQLQALASRAPLQLAEDGALDRRLYEDYLRTRCGTVEVHSPLQCGLLYRLYKELVNRGAWQEAGEVEQRLRALCAERYRLDLSRPEAVCIEEAAAAGWDEFARGVPMNLTGVLFYAGLMRLHGGQGAAAALGWFEAAARAARLFRRMNRLISLEDGEVEELGWQARVRALHCLAEVAPERALTELSQLVPLSRAEDPISALPDALLAKTRRDVMLRLAAPVPPREAQAPIRGGPPDRRYRERVRRAAARARQEVRRLLFRPRP